MIRFAACVTILGFLASVTGCAVKDAVKKVAGTSTSTLEERRTDGLSKTFFCTYQDCYDAIIALGKRKDPVKPWVHDDSPDPGLFTIFMSDLYANPPYIILMGVEGSVDTTEVGVFLERMTEDTIRVDVSSLASGAKRTAAQIIFKHLENNFQLAE